ncbi:hypothetical protein FQN54_002637 [Arachnomyces sp. PD_36]|nr:hypothetical protein FQN54_002637 [Arachnomyces sp. PD_36]
MAPLLSENFLGSRPSPVQSESESGPRTHSMDISWDRRNCPCLTTAAAWSILSTRWFYLDELDMSVTVGTPPTTLPVRLSVHPELTVAQIFQQLPNQQGKAAISSESDNPGVEEKKASEPFSVVQVEEAAGGLNKEAVRLDGRVDNHGLHLQMTFYSNTFEHQETKRLVRSLEFVLAQLTGEGVGQKSITEIELAGKQDICDIWKWNASVPAGVDICVHQLFGEYAREHPDKPAVCAWDGELTYRELDERSTRLARQLAKLGVKKNVIVSLCFEKSMWMPVAMLSVLKAGGVAVQFGSTMPKLRIQTIASIEKPLLALASSSSSSWLNELVQTYTPEKLLLEDEQTCEQWHPSECHPDQDALRLFTSGSTGNPKCIVLSHGVLAGSCTAMTSAFPYGPDIRMFQSASYEFDVSVLETYATFISGGCLCIPPEWEGVNASPQAMERFRVDMAGLTPTLAASLEPDSVPSLRYLVLDGEILSRDTATKWARRLQLYTWYGLSECPLVASCQVDPVTFRTGFVGSDPASNRWLVDPHNDNNLVPIGAIGEVLVEGPMIPTRYAGVDTYQDKFVSPEWLERGAPGYAGRRGRLFKTGDLAWRDPDGAIVIIGRKDTQVQIRAERVELSEVEHHVRRFINNDIVKCVVAEVITPNMSSKRLLVAFIAIGGEENGSSDNNSEILRAATTELDTLLAENIPGAMVPSAFIPIDTMPMTITGKTDRRRLRKIGELHTEKQLKELLLKGRKLGTNLEEIRTDRSRLKHLVTSGGASFRGLLISVLDKMSARHNNKTS